ncbi:GIY-YIG nuclease family protein [Microbacterium neungamense]|uniref:GIY-YIG nuclease family protein n=1 Tax=Microbacterium neungamense TaxID=2810535 RepID=UPI00217D9A90|nr:GIY-YIG nuclease family protein [Microbacterium neungamense]UWF78441.1 GIY-YIG nuclease family protein [Microbacterium neungamense]
MAWMYILRCRDGTYYTGSTAIDVEARVWEHNNDERAASYTRKRRPVTLAYAEFFDSVEAAFRREKQVQGWSRTKKEVLMAGRGDELPQLSRTRLGSKGTAEGTADASTSSASER